MIVLPFLTVLTKAFSTIYSRWILRTFHVAPIQAITVGFSLSLILMFLLSPFFGSLEQQFFTWPYPLFLIGSVAIGLTANIFALRGLKRDSLRNFELVEVVTPLATMGMAALIFADEREPVQLALGLLAGASFFFTHIEHQHFRLSQTDRWLVVSVGLFALESILVKPLLEVIAPVTYYGLRAGSIALLGVVLFHPNLTGIPTKVWGHASLNTLLAGIRSIALLYSIRLYGIVFTQLILLTEPLVLASISRFALHERWSFRQGLGFSMIILCIALVELLS